MTRRKYIVGNWKMHGLAASLSEARLIAEYAASQPIVDVALCPPATLIAAMHSQLPDFQIGAQDCHEAESGAYTGCVSAAMLADAGARLVLAGHSERRQAFGERDCDVLAKAKAALKAGLSVILCVGEPLAIRESGSATAYVLKQVAASLPSEFVALRLAIAYEPIWAIGTGLTATIGDVEAMHEAIRHTLRQACGDKADKIRLIYGGSVNRDNAAELLAARDVDGVLVGGASLTAARFLPVVQAAVALTS